MGMTEEQYRLFMETYFKNNHIPDRDRHKWDAGTKQLLRISEKSGIDRWIERNKQEQELTKQQEDARNAYLYKTGSGYKSQVYKDNTDSWKGQEFADNTKYLPPPESEEETDYPLHRMCEDCYKERFSTEKWNLYFVGEKLLKEQEPCHYCFNPTRSIAAFEEENRKECSFLHLEREDDE